MGCNLLYHTFVTKFNIYIYGVFSIIHDVSLNLVKRLTILEYFQYVVFPVFTHQKG